MNCPHCQQVVAPAAPRCEACDFDLQRVREILGDQWVRLEHLTDAAHCLRLRERRRVEAALDDFGRQFPQVFMSVYFGVLPHGLNVAEAGFWLLNHAAFSTNSMEKRNDFGLVIVIDPSVASAGITLGYALEGFLPDRFLKTVLASVSGQFAQSAYGGALEQILARIAKHLRGAGTAQPSQADGWSPPQESRNMGLAPLRPHRTPAQAEASAGEVPAG